MQFVKYQGLGNDYIVVDGYEWENYLTTEIVCKVCDRHYGVGSDGILIHEKGRDRDDIRLRILNPDGSLAEKSGNGLRIFSRYLWDKRIVGDAPFKVTTPGGVVQCQVFDDGQMVRVEMGQVRFDSEAIPVLGPPREVLRETMIINGQTLEYCAATLGNPHCVVLRERVSESEARALGPSIEWESRFPRRTNVQFLQILDRNNIRIEIWERGAGYTLASGSSSCAAAAVAKKLGYCDSAITVHMPGGKLAIEIDDTFFARMTGPVGKVVEGRLSEEILREIR